MMNIGLPLLLTTISGLSTMLGTLIIFKKKTNKILITSLSFSAGVMFFISILNLIPSGYTYLIKQYSILLIIILILVGMMSTYLIDEYIPVKNDNLYKIGIFSCIALVLHNVPEGIITFFSTLEDVSLGITLCIAILMHNIPEGITISLPIYYSTNSKFKALFYTFISGISEPLGGLFIFLLLNKYINHEILSMILLFTGGMMIYISVFKLIPTVLKYKKYRLMFISLLFSLILVIINEFIFH